MGCVPGDEAFLANLRNMCDGDGILLIFDEVMTGFRLARGGAQEIYGITPDLTTFGKVIGGGLPVGAYGGREEIMNMIAPAGPVYQAGTLSGNPLAMAAGSETLRVIDEDPEFYSKLESSSAQLANGLSAAIAEKQLNCTINRVGSMLTVFFTDIAVTDFDTAKRSDTQIFAKVFGEMIENGVYLPPSQFESMFVSAAHTQEDIHHTVHAFSQAFG
jgi:glutamate-1-semialdehyde 2,1-aminomutase